MGWWTYCVESAVLSMFLCTHNMVVIIFYIVDWNEFSQTASMGSCPYLSSTFLLVHRYMHGYVQYQTKVGMTKVVLRGLRGCHHCKPDRGPPYFGMSSRDVPTLLVTNMQSCNIHHCMIACSVRFNVRNLHKVYKDPQVVCHDVTMKVNHTDWWTTSCTTLGMLIWTATRIMGWI